jgi:putative transposase
MYLTAYTNGVAERFILSAHTEILNQIIVFNEDHLRRLMNEYVEYYNKDRCHLSLERDSPLGRKVDIKPVNNTEVQSLSLLGGLHYKYFWSKAA